MKTLLNLLSILTFLFITQFSNAQNLKVDSIFNWGQTGWELPADMIPDTDGNYYITGSFAGEMTIANQLIKSNGKRDIFIVKYNQANEFQWVKNFGGQGDDNAYSLLFSNNKIYLAGSFKKQISFNNETISLQGQGLTDVFLAQLSTEGNVLWAKAITSKAPAQKAFLQADSTGNIWIAGSFAKPVEAGNTTINSGTKKGVYFASFSPSGIFNQISHFTGNGTIELSSFIINPTGQFYFAGTFSESMDIQGHSISSNGKTDGFIAKFDTGLNGLWIKNIGGQYDDEIKNMAIDAQGNIYAVGDFKYEINLVSQHLAPQNTDAFIVKFTPEGAMEWGTQLGTEGESFNTVSNIEMAGNGRFFLSGGFRGKIQNSPEVKSGGNTQNAFIARFQTNGKRDWILGTSSLSENNVTINYNHKTGGLFISGYFSNSFKLADFEIENKNYKDIYFGSLIDCDLAPQAELGADTSLCTGIELKPNVEFMSYLWGTGQTGASIKPIESGIYSLQATDKYGCVSNDTIKLTLLPSPVIDLGADASICDGQNIVLTAAQGFEAYLWDNDSTQTVRTITKSGDYWLKVTGSIGCSGMDTLTLTVNLLPEFEIEQAIQADASDIVRLSPNLAQGNYSFIWGNGSTDSTISLPLAQYTSPKSIGLTVTDQNQCSFTNELIIGQANSPLSVISENGQGSNYKIFPNPGNGLFYISTPEPELVKQIDIYDMRGMLVKTIQNIQNFPIEADLTGQAKGSYLVKISEDKVGREFKVVVE